MTVQQENRQPLRVGQVIGRLSIGGAERHYVSLCNALTGCEVTAFFVSKPQSSPSLEAELLADVRRVHVPIRKRWFFAGVRRLGAALKEARCDVVHTHMFWPTLYGCLAARLAGVPVVVSTEHGENRWKKAWHRWLEKYVISKVTSVRFCVSPEIARRRAEVDGVPVSQLRVIANGTTVPELRPVSRTSSSTMIGSVGRLVLQKNFPLLLKAIRELRSDGYNVRACVVGDGPEMHVIRQLVSDYGLVDVVELPGFDTDTSSWYRRFDVYVNSSSEEGQPVSVLEAMSYALPVVACDVGAMREMLVDGEEGIIIAPDNLAELVRAIKTYLDDPALGASHGINARNRVVNEFSIEAVASIYQQNYIDLLMRRQSRIA